ncbi:MAG TPA: SLC13/DASS family transporter [Gammaproteobacteria bacterium]|nr:SLC13/DASS family transporter [Gammaproteobacteria bacterium]
MRGARRLALWLGPLCALGCLLWVEVPDRPAAGAMLGVALWMALWWISECVPLAVTALIPVIVFPLTGIAPARETAPRYMSSIMFLFVGGFLVAQALEVCGLHRRIALAILQRLHRSPVQILAGFGLATAVLSMWISNTATTMLMVTIAMAVLKHLDHLFAPRDMARLAPALLLVVAYAANIGGMGTPVGTVPNLVLLENLRTIEPALVPGFLQWMLLGVPLVVLGLVLVLVVLAWPLRKLPWPGEVAGGLEAEHKALGAMGRDERFVAWVLGLTALAWLTRQGIKGEGFEIPGWSAWLPHGGVDDGTVAMVGALVLFLAPVRAGAPILGRDAIQALPWNILILLGGGFALAYGMKVSGLSLWLGEQLTGFGQVPLPLMLLGVALAVTFLTEISSNTATTQILLPVLAGVALAEGQDPVSIMLAATLAASCAFMLPVATPPNAIVFGTARLPMQAMVRAGIRLNLLLPFLILALLWWLRPLLPG